MSVATKDLSIMTLREMFGKTVEFRVEGVGKQIREAAEAKYVKTYKECEDAGDSYPLCPETEAEIKKEFTDEYIYYRGFQDGVRLSSMF